ncbi:MAG: hypothetical protein ACO3FP_07220 [Burkholderiales bacterium]
MKRAFTIPLSNVLNELQVLVQYEVLPAEAGLPEQIDIKTAWLDLEHQDRPRRVNILGALTESNLMLLEDEALEHHQSLQKPRQDRDPRQLELLPEPYGSVEAGATRVGVPVPMQYLSILVED